MYLADVAAEPNLSLSLPSWITTAILLAAIGLIVFLFFYDRHQGQHSVLRNYPLLGRLRYMFESIGPEMRQYLFDSDSEGRPFNRNTYVDIVKSGKYASTVISFGSKRDFEAPGFYIKNSMFPKLPDEMKADNDGMVATRAYRIDHEGLFSRREQQVGKELSPWRLTEEEAIVVGPDLPHPFRLTGQVGMSAMSYGSIGDRAHTALSEGLALAGASWVNTGEGGLAPFHLAGGGDVVAQIGPGLFGYRTPDGQFDWDELKRKAEVPELRAFELKLGQGAKIRGGHLPAEKVNPEIAAIRTVEPWKSVESPNRFREFGDVPSLVEFVNKMRRATGKPVGIKVVVGGPGALDELCAYMARHGGGPDFLTVDGGEGGSGATYTELADDVGLPIQSAIIIADDALRHYGLRDRVRIFASGKLASAGRIAAALGMGADAVNIARGLMISLGCIMALECHTNRCPVGVATTDPKYQRSLVVSEKKYRVANYVLTLRQGLFAVAAAAGLPSPRHFNRSHVVYRHADGRITALDELFPYPDTAA